MTRFDWFDLGLGQEGLYLGFVFGTEGLGPGRLRFLCFGRKYFLFGLVYLGLSDVGFEKSGQGGFVKQGSER